LSIALYQKIVEFGINTISTSRNAFRSHRRQTLLTQSPTLRKTLPRNANIYYAAMSQTSR